MTGKRYDAKAAKTYTGEVVAYVCGRCGNVVGIEKRPGKSRSEEDRTFARIRAEKCCVCKRCGARPVGSDAVWCVQCRDEIDRAVREAADEAERKASDTFDGAKNRLAAGILLGELESISEECWRASWLSDLEDGVWVRVECGGGPYGMGEITEDRAEILRALFDLAGGWFRWDDDAGEAVFVGKAEWLEHRTEGDDTLSKENDKTKGDGR